MNLKSCLLLALAFATILASAARADVVDNALANTTARGASEQQLVVPYLAQQYGIEPTSVRPDDRAGIRGLPSPTTEAVSSTTDGGLAWGDAGMVAGAAAGVLLVALAVGLTVRHSRHLLY